MQRYAKGEGVGDTERDLCQRMEFSILKRAREWAAWSARLLISLAEERKTIRAVSFRASSAAPRRSLCRRCRCLYAPRCTSRRTRIKARRSHSVSGLARGFDLRVSRRRRHWDLLHRLLTPVMPLCSYICYDACISNRSIYF